MKTEPVVTGIIGDGHVCEHTYLTNIVTRFPVLRVKTFSSPDQERVKAECAKFKEYQIHGSTVEDMIADPQIELVIVLTPMNTHYLYAKMALLAGKHVYTEKSMTDTFEQASELVKLASEKGLFYGVAPDTHMGCGVQTARKAIDEGLIGEVTSFSACANRDNDYLLSHYAFLQNPGCGIVYDYSVYYITALVDLLGPVARLSALTRAPYRTHINHNPDSPDYLKQIECPNESEMCASMQMQSGVLGTILFNSDSILDLRNNQILDLRNNQILIHGTKGVLRISDVDFFDAEVVLFKGSGDQESRKLEPVNPYKENWRGLGPADLALALRRGTDPRNGYERAYHIYDVLHSIMVSAQTGCLQEIATSCSRPLPLLGELDMEVST